MLEDEKQYFSSWFNQYADSFSSPDEVVEANLRYKKEHSFRVRDNMLTIGGELNLNEEQMLLAELIGLFHDVGRFEQYWKYHTFKDHKSEDHAELGLSILERHQILAGHVSDLNRDMIYCSIRNHNKRVIPEDVQGDTLMFCRLIRDADKLDILEQVINYYENPQGTPHLAVEDYSKDESYSEEIVQAILNGGKVDYSLVKTGVDIRLVRLAWLLDISYPAALKIAIGKHYPERIMAFLPRTEDILKVYRVIEEYMKQPPSHFGG